MSREGWGTFFAMVTLTVLVGWAPILVMLAPVWIATEYLGARSWSDDAFAFFSLLGALFYLGLIVLGAVAYIKISDRFRW